MSKVGWDAHPWLEDGSILESEFNCKSIVVRINGTARHTTYTYMSSHQPRATLRAMSQREHNRSEYTRKDVCVQSPNRAPPDKVVPGRDEFL